MLTLLLSGVVLGISHGFLIAALEVLNSRVLVDSEQQPSGAVDVVFECYECRSLVDRQVGLFSECLLAHDSTNKVVRQGHTCLPRSRNYFAAIAPKLLVGPLDLPIAQVEHMGDLVVVEVVVVDGFDDASSITLVDLAGYDFTRKREVKLFGHFSKVFLGNYKLHNRIALVSTFVRC